MLNLCLVSYTVNATEEMSNDIIIESDDDNSEEISPMVEPPQFATFVSGTILWEVDDEGNTLPVRNLRVDIAVNDSEGNNLYEVSTYTDSDGVYELGISTYGMLEVYFSLSLHLESHTIVMQYKNDSNDYVPIFTTFYDGLYDGVGDYYCPTYTIERSDEIIYTKMRILQTMIAGERYVLSKGFNPSGKLRIVYIDLSILHEFIFGNKVNGFTYNKLCCLTAGAETNPDLLIHEYGHFYQQESDLYDSELWEMLYNDPNHEKEADNFKEKASKDYAMELTWTEAWACTFSLIVQNEYYSEYYKISGFEANAKYFGKDYESYGVKDNSCEAQEAAVIAFLWNLYDTSPKPETWDNIAWGESNWWNMTTATINSQTNNRITILEEFVSYTYSNSSLLSQRSYIGKLLERFQIAPGDLQNSIIGTQTSPGAFSWKVNGSVNNPNNKFELIIYDNSNIMLISKIITSTKSYTSTESYTFTMTEWNTIINRYSLSGTYNFKAVVRGYNTSSPESGPYHSAFINFSIVLTFAHTHSYTYRYVSNNDMATHTAYCACGIAKTENCTGKSTPNGSVCKKCNQSLFGFVIGKAKNKKLEVKD